VLRIEQSWYSAKGKPGTAAHKQAAEWYEQQGLPLPRNCMVIGSEPLPLDFTDKDNPELREWELHYWQVARKHGVFHACESIFCDVNDPPRLRNQQLAEWFGTIPDTWGMPPLPPPRFAKLLRWIAGQTSDAASRDRLEALARSLLHCASNGDL